MFVYIAIYFFLNVLYRTILTEEGWEEYRYTFESLKGTSRITLQVYWNSDLKINNAYVKEMMITIINKLYTYQIIFALNFYIYIYIYIRYNQISYTKGQRNFSEKKFILKSLWSILQNGNKFNPIDFYTGILCQHDCNKMVATIYIIALARFYCNFPCWTDERFVNLFYFYIYGTLPGLLI